MPTLKVPINISAELLKRTSPVTRADLGEAWLAVAAECPHKGRGHGPGAENTSDGRRAHHVADSAVDGRSVWCWNVDSSVSDTAPPTPAQRHADATQALFDEQGPGDVKPTCTHVVAGPDGCGECIREKRGCKICKTTPADFAIGERQGERFCEACYVELVPRCRLCDEPISHSNAICYACNERGPTARVTHTAADGTTETTETPAECCTVQLWWMDRPVAPGVLERALRFCRGDERGWLSNHERGVGMPDATTLAAARLATECARDHSGRRPRDMPERRPLGIVNPNPSGVWDDEADIPDADPTPGVR